MRGLKYLLLAEPAVGEETPAEVAVFGRYRRPILSAYRRALPRYAPQPYPGRLTLFLGTDTVTGWFRDSRLIWGRLAEGGAEVRVVPGDHLKILQEPHVAALAEALDEHLRAAQTLETES